MKCLACDAENKDGAKFCRACGTAMKQVQAEEGKKCPVCENMNKAGTKFCLQCGHNFLSALLVSTPAPISTPEPAPITTVNIQPEEDSLQEMPEKQVACDVAARNDASVAGKRGTVLLAAGILICVIGGGAAYWWLGRDASNPAPDSMELLQSAATVEPAVQVPPVPPIPVRPDEPRSGKPRTAASNVDKSEPVRPVAPPSAPVRDVKLEPQYEQMLAMGERMYNSHSYLAALDLAKQVLSKRPNSLRARNLKNKSQEQIERQQSDLQGLFNK